MKKKKINIPVALILWMQLRLLADKITIFYWCINVLLMLSSLLFTSHVPAEVDLN